MAMKRALLSASGTAATMAFLGGTALAGSPAGCGVNAGIGCDTSVSILAAPPTYADTATVENRTPYDFLDSVHFQRAPHTSITRIHGLSPTVTLADSPVGFTDNCHPSSTAYCRSGHASASASASATSTVISRTVTPRFSQAPIVQAPTVRAPVTYTPPVTSVTPPRVVAIGGGYDASKFTPRIYGDPYTITPGIAHVPTSFVDRNPHTAQAVLNSGHARPNPLTRGGTTPALLGVPVRPHVPAPIGFTTHSAQTITRGSAYSVPVMPYAPSPMVYPASPTQMTAGRYGGGAAWSAAYGAQSYGHSGFGSQRYSQGYSQGFHQPPGYHRGNVGVCKTSNPYQPSPCHGGKPVKSRY